MNQDIIAVDVALVPSDELMRFVISLNRNFNTTDEKNWILDRTTCIPHITLLMGLLSQKQLPEVIRLLTSIAESVAPLNLQITGISVPPRPDGKIISSLLISKSPELQKFHERVLEAMSSFFRYDGVTKEMFYSPPPVNSVPLHWIKGFAQTGVREHYSPHITLGMGKPKKISLPIQFAASRLALCHLGNYCTCRKILWSTELKTRPDMN